jgi:hypothetical protein
VKPFKLNHFLLQRKAVRFRGLKSAVAFAIFRLIAAAFPERKRIRIPGGIDRGKRETARTNIDNAARRVRGTAGMRLRA